MMSAYQIREESQAVSKAIRDIIENPIFAGARFGIDVRDLASGAPIFQHNAHDLFVGASTTKILTAVFALALLGSDFRFHTKLVQSGNVDKSGTLRGDLILVASGDPNLSNRVTANDTLDFESLDHSYAGAKARLIPRDPVQIIHAFARSARDAGIRRITGTVLVDNHLFEERRRDLGTDVTVSPVAINDNLIDIEAVGGVRAGDPVTYRLSPVSGYVRFIDRATTGESISQPMLQFSEERSEADGTWSVIISGSVPAGSTSMAAFPVESPSRFARTLLTEALASAGIVVEGGLFGVSATSGAAPTEAIVVGEHISPPLLEATKIMLKISQNLHAEMLIPLIGATLRGVCGAEASAAGYACSAELLARWGIDTTGLFQGDACGARGHFSPDFMSRLLVRIAASEIGSAFLHGLPIMGKDGTLWDIQSNSSAAGNVYAKTGTIPLADPLNGAILFRSKGLAGYLDAKNGRRLVFTFYLNNFCAPRASAVNPGQVLGELAVALYEHL